MEPNPSSSPISKHSPMTRSDPEEVVIRSTIRSGHKREFAFALKSQCEVGSSVGRTRSTNKTTKESPPENGVGPGSEPRHQPDGETTELPLIDDDDEVIIEDGRDVEIKPTEKPKSTEMPLKNDDKATMIMEDGRKMEIKLTKRSELTIKPMNVGGLLKTGLLDGLWIKCIVPGIDEEMMLQGMIKEGKIFCYCISCKRVIGVSAYQFEQHSGLMEAHPAEFIQFENGKTCHDILEACITIPLHMMGSLVQELIGPTQRKIYTCQICGESVNATRTNKFTLLCDLCLEVSHNMSTSSTSDGSSSYTRALKKTSLVKKATTGKLKKNVGLHKLLFENGGLLKMVKDKTVSYSIGGKVSPSQFEDHAGHSQKRKPYHHIYLPDGLSLHELSVCLSSESEQSSGQNDDLCNICKEEIPDNEIPTVL